MTEDETRLAKDRLMKLWDGYETQNKELTELKAKIGDLQVKEKDKERIIQTLRELVETKDEEIRKFEIQSSSLKNENTDIKNRIEDLSQSLEKERNRYKKLYIISEGLEREVDHLRRNLEERDNWYKDNLSFFQELPERLKKRDEMISRISGRSSLLDALEAPSSDSPALEPHVEETTFQKVDRKAENMKELMSLPGVDEEKAQTLIRAGYTDFDKLKGISPFDLVKLDGITPTIARKITEHVKAQ
ncbi:MAG: helix-hairpin-helix domain-containing protein [Thermoplasmatota archaeon]